MADLSGDEKNGVATHVPDAQVHESPQPEKMTAGKYAATRITTLKPPMNNAPNPFTLLAMLSGKQWLFFLVGFLAWVRFLRYHHTAFEKIY
jgi:SHS family lactate transporter-like MFS transporter